MRLDPDVTGVAGILFDLTISEGGDSLEPDAAPEQPVLEARGVWCVFGGDEPAAIDLARGGADRQHIASETGGVVAVRDVSFSVRRGESFIVMGLSGSGKSTLLRCLVRLLEPTAGEVVLDGVNLLDLGPDELREVRRHRIAMVFQHFGLFPHRSVLDNVTYGLEVQGVDRGSRISVGLDALDQVGLADWADHFPQQLSGGMQQRVGLARALAVEPEVLFFDEPFSALDPLIRRDMQDELLALQRSRRRTVVFVTHDFDEALKLGDRIAIMKDGAFDQVGTPVQLVTQPGSDYVREFTRDVPMTKVVTVGAVVRPDPERGSSQAALEPVADETPLEQVLPLLLSSDAPVPVTGAGGRHLGVIDRDAVRMLLSGSGPP